MFEPDPLSIAATTPPPPQNWVDDQEVVPSITSRLFVPITSIERRLANLVADSRPRPLRAFDQIPMRTGDLARQVKLMAPLLARQRVVFIGDMDGTASGLPPE